MKIVLASRNKKKISELQTLLAQYIEGIEILSLDDVGIYGEIEEDGKVFEDNALIKARVAATSGYIGVGDDSGLEVDALGGAPGVYTARYAGPDKGSDANMEKLLSELAAIEAKEGKISRAARFRTVVALIINGETKIFEGVMEGEIARERSGSEGFGYDPVFIPQGYSCTIAEISLDEKNAISHRGKAMRALAQYLNTL